MRTKRALQQAALDLFADQGYDTTTTDEIAERAGVSPRTFFRYFPTKESVLFVGEYGWFQSFTQQFLDQPEELTDVEAIRQTLLTLAPGLTKIRKALVLYERAVASSATLRGGVQDHQQEDIAQIALAIATRRGLRKPDQGCTLLAATILMLYRGAVMQWLGGPASVDPRKLITRQFDVLLDELGAGGAATPKRPRRRSTTRQAG